MTISGIIEAFEFFTRLLIVPKEVVNKSPDVPCGSLSG